MRKLLLFTTLLVVAVNSLTAQKQFAPKLEWSKCYGDTLSESMHSILATSDSSIIYNEYKLDCFQYINNLVKVRKNGNIAWSTSIPLGWINTMFEYNPNKFFVFYEPYLSSTTVTIIKGFDSLGVMVFSKTINGIQPMQAIKARNGDIIIVGYDGEPSTNSNIIVARVDINGNVKWKKNFGGSKSEIGDVVFEQDENNIIIAGRTSSNDGDMVGHHGILYDDIGMISLDSLGNKKWSKCYGGSKTDNVIGILPNNNTSFYLLGNTSSYDGDIVGNHGDSSVFYGSGTNEIWLSLIDTNGNIIRSKSFGNDSVDVSWSVSRTSDKKGILVYGNSNQRTNTGDLYNFFTDTIKSYVWVARFDSLFNLQWFKSLGGTPGISYYKHMNLRFGCNSNEGKYYGAAEVTSNGDDVLDYHTTISNTCTGNKQRDIWIFKLAKDTIYPYPTIQGYIFTDHNSNSTKDTLEPYKANVKVQLSNGNYTFTDNNGFYQIQTDSIGAYTLIVTASNLYSAVPQTINYNFTSWDTVINKNIALQPTVVKDSVAINVIPMVMNAVQGGSMPYWVQYDNVGTTILSPTVNLTYNNYLLAYDSCTDVNAVVVANGIFTGALNMQPGKRNELVSYFTVKPLANIGDTLRTVYSISTTSISQTDSFYMLIESGVAAPNAQRATPSLTDAQVAAGKEIVYTIGFKNTGNDIAYNIVITDTLSSLLNANTLQMLASSHTCKTTVKGNVVMFELLNINLPKTSSNAAKSMGFVSFKIKPQNSLTVGTVITNKANTYYNYRAPQSSTATTIIKAVVTPVTMVDYELRMANDKAIENKWKTANEVNVSYFNIQRSLNGKNFVTIGKVKAGIFRYSFIDNKLPISNDPLTISYRLEIADKDGSKTYSEIKTMNLKQQALNGISLYPNPAKDVVTVECKGVKELDIIDCLGRIVVTKKNINNQSSIINIQDFLKGVYVVKMVTNNNTILFKKFIKQ